MFLFTKTRNNLLKYPRIVNDSYISVYINSEIKDFKPQSMKIFTPKNLPHGSKQ